MRSSWPCAVLVSRLVAAAAATLLLALPAPLRAAPAPGEPAGPAAPASSPVAARATQTADAPHPARWGVEVDLVQPWIPEVHILSLRVTRTVRARGSQRSELMVGVYARPRVSHDIVETIDEYLLAVGLRHTLWRGLHLEAAVLAGWAWGENNRIDGMDHANPAVLLEGQLGYRFTVRRATADRVGLYLAPQAGVLTGVFTDIGPRGGKSDTFLEGKLLAGVTF